MSKTEHNYYAAKLDFMPAGGIWKNRVIKSTLHYTDSKIQINANAEPFNKIFFPKYILPYKEYIAPETVTVEVLFVHEFLVGIYRDM